MISPSCWFTVPLPLFVALPPTLNLGRGIRQPAAIQIQLATTEVSGQELREDLVNSRAHETETGFIRLKMLETSMGQSFHLPYHSCGSYVTSIELIELRLLEATRCCFATPQNQAAPRSALSFQAERGVILLTRNGGPQRSGPSNEVLQTPPPKPTVNT